MSEALNIQPIELNPIQAQPESAEPNRPRERKKRSSFQDWLDARRESRSEAGEQPPTSFHFFDELKRSLGIGEFAEPEPTIAAGNKSIELDDLQPQEKQVFFAEVTERFRAAGSRLLGVTSLGVESSTDSPKETQHTLHETGNDHYNEHNYHSRSLEVTETAQVDSDTAQHIHAEVPDPSPVEIHYPVEDKSTPTQPLRRVITSGLAAALWSRDPYARLERRTRRHKRAIRKLTSENREIKKELRNVKRIQKKLPAVQNVTGLPSVEAKIAAIIDVKVPRSGVEHKENPKPYSARKEVLRLVRSKEVAKVTVAEKSVHETASDSRVSPKIEVINTAAHMQTEIADTTMEFRQESLIRANQYITGVTNTENSIRNTTNVTNSVQRNDDKNTTVKLLKSIKNSARDQSQSEPWIITATVVVLLVLLGIVILS